MTEDIRERFLHDAENNSRLIRSQFWIVQRKKRLILPESGKQKACNCVDLHDGASAVNRNDSLRSVLEECTDNCMFFKPLRGEEDLICVRVATSGGCQFAQPPRNISQFDTIFGPLLSICRIIFDNKVNFRHTTGNNHLHALITAKHGTPDHSPADCIGLTLPPPGYCRGMDYTEIRIPLSLETGRYFMI